MKRGPIVIILLSASPALALTFMGPPTSNVAINKAKVGLEYSTGRTTLGVSDSGFGGTIDDMKTHMYLARLDYGIQDKVDLYTRVGFVDVDDSGNELAWGLGIKGTLSGSGELYWGCLAQFMSMNMHDSEVIGGYKATINGNIYEIQLAAGPAWEIIETLIVYGGPFLHFVAGEMNMRRAGARFSFDLEQESMCGVYAGIAGCIDNQLELHVEYQITAEADALGISVLWRL